MAADNRRFERLMLHWRISVLYEDAKELELFYATTSTISITGCSIYLDRQILVEHPVTVQLIIPPDVSVPAEGEGEPIKMTALMKYGYMCRARHQFRVGLDFIQYAGDSKARLIQAFSTIVQRDELRKKAEW